MNVETHRVYSIIYICALVMLLTFCLLGSAHAKPNENASAGSTTRTTTADTIKKSTSDTSEAAAELTAIEARQNELKQEALTTKKRASSTTTEREPASIEAQTRLDLHDYQDPAKPQKQQSVLGGILDTAINIIKYAFYLGIVLAIGFLAIYGVKIVTNKYNTLAGGGHELLNIVEMRYIAPGKAIGLIEVAGKVIVIGLAGNNIHHLSDIDEPQQVEFIKHKAAQRPEPLQPFQSALEKVTNRFVYSPTKNPKGTQPGRAARKGREASARTQNQDQNNWADELHTTGDNIRKLLDEIKEQERRSNRGPNQTPRPNRGDED